MKLKKLPVQMLMTVLTLSASPVWAAPVPAPAVAAPSALPVDVPVESGQVEEVRTIFGKTCSVRVHGGDATAAKAATGRALAEIARVLTNYVQPSKTSELHSINANAGTDEVVVTDETYTLLQRSLDLCRRSGGAYDPTVATWDYLWNFKVKPFVRPLPEELAARRGAVGCKQLVIKPNRAVRLMHAGARATLAGMATGFALERAAQLLRDGGLADFRIQVGDDTYAQGRIGTRHWHVVAPNTRHLGTPLALLYLSSHAAVTRSDSDVNVLRGGKRYHDVLDPRTGNPTEVAVQATVIATDPSTADALSNAVMVLGPKAGLALLAKEKNVEGFIVDASGKIFATPGMADHARLPAKMEL